MDDGTVTGRAFTIVDVVATYGPHLRLAELTARTSIPKPTVRRIAEDLVHRTVLTRSAHGYCLGPTLERLGRPAALQLEFAAARDVLVNLHAMCGGIAWLTAGGVRPTQQPVDIVCDDELSDRARREWPAADSEATLLNTASGRVFLANRPDLFESVVGALDIRRRITSDGLHRLERRLRQVRDLGAAVESGEILAGWVCVAAPFLNKAGQLAVVGVTVPTNRAVTARMVRGALTSSAALTASSAARAAAGHGAVMGRPSTGSNRQALRGSTRQD